MSLTRAGTPTIIRRALVIGAAVALLAVGAGGTLAASTTPTLYACFDAYGNVRMTDVNTCKLSTGGRLVAINTSGGPTGPTGATGPAGATGQQGPIGASGPAGPSDGWTVDQGNVLVPDSMTEDTVVAQATNLPIGNYIFNYTALAYTNPDIGFTHGTQMQCSVYVGNTRAFPGPIVWVVQNPLYANQSRVPLALTGGFQYQGGDPTTTVEVRCGTNNSGDMIAAFSRLTIIAVGTLHGSAN